MQHIELYVDINATTEQVFEYLTDWPKQSEWVLGTHVEIRTPGLAKEVGGKIAAFTGIGPIGFWDYMTIIKWEYAKAVDVVHTGRVVKGTGSMRVEKLSENKSRFYWSEDLEIPLGPIGLLGFRILKPLFLKGVHSSLKKFGRILESRVN
ncbi:MAG: hypothetical protein RJA41_319 [Actinomycetota bacterium]|jgi:hypothetical protein